ncbi:MAG: hypothetical protein M1820_007346 [Bogoriella megaspora]|nr:MAG: hypothetical protein M1820_007346 [Bogoriella megaspora]
MPTQSIPVDYSALLAEEHAIVQDLQKRRFKETFNEDAVDAEIRACIALLEFEKPEPITRDGVSIFVDEYETAGLIDTGHPWHQIIWIAVLASLKMPEDALVELGDLCIPWYTDFPKISLGASSLGR